jgi:8-oxo-dGTP diphosphatase
MAESEQAIITVLCMIYRGQEILLQNRLKKDWAGYTFPGGHVEKEESFVDAVRREMKEETGLLIYHPRLCGLKQFQTDKDERYVVALFKTNEFEGRLTSSEEGDMVWVDRKDLFRYPLVDDFPELLEVFDREELTEFQYLRGNGKDWTVRIL